MEILVGVRNKVQQHHAERFLRRFHVIKVNESITDAAITLIQTYRLSHNLMIPDGLIAATAMVLDIPFVSKNQRDYRFIKNLQLLSYP